MKTTRCRFKVDKLIRDKLPDLMRAKGLEVFERAMDKSEYIQRLKDKLVEEVEEVRAAQGLEALRAELADLVEVVISLGEACDLPFAKIEEARLQKKAEVGGFEGGVYVSCVEMDEQNTCAKYYLSYPAKYLKLPVS